MGSVQHCVVYEVNLKRKQYIISLLININLHSGQLTNNNIRVYMLLRIIMRLT